MNNIISSIYQILKDNQLYGLDSIYSLTQLLFEYKKTKKLKPTSKFDANIINNIVSLLSKNDINQINIDDIFRYHLENDNLNVIKEYSKFYNNKILIDHIVSLSNINRDNMGLVLDGNVKINSFMDSVINICSNSAQYINKIYGVQTNDIVKNIMMLHIQDKTMIDFSPNICNDDIILKDINLSTKFFDLIFCDFPSGIHNIIHASCCNKIKKLKLRGTKMEPLLLQLIMMSLNKNGKAFLIVPDSLLFSDSVQPIETRKYLLENFNIKKIIEINEMFYVGKGIKNSILYFENNGPTTKPIEFSKISMDQFNKVEETKIIDLSANLIKDNNYSLWYKQYNDNTMTNDKVEHVSIESVFTINTDYMKIPKVTKLLVIDKYYNDNESVKVIDIKDIEKYKHYMYFLTSNDMNDFILYHFHSIVNNLPEQFTKGKMKQFDISKIKSYSIPSLDKHKQLPICNYIELTNKIINENIKHIDEFTLLKKYLMETIPLNQYDVLEKIGTLYSEDICKNDKMVGVIRNGLSAGSVYLVNKNDKLSNNSYYLSINNNDYMVDFVYYWLQYMETKMKELSNLTPQPNLNKSNLLSFNIPQIDIMNQKNIVSYCEEFDSNIRKYTLANENIKEKNIFTLFKNLCC